jgi:1,4-alpha-glucan branching enzyme
MQEKSYDYQWEELYDNQEAKKNISNWKSDYGPLVLERDSEQKAKKTRFQILIDNQGLEIYLVGSFNNWEKDTEKLEEFRLEHDDFSLFASIETEKVSHKDPYKFLIKEGSKTYYLPDPAASYFDHEGNSIFWDFEDPNSYKLKYPFVDTFHRSTRIAQTDLPGLISHYAHQKTRKLGKEIPQSEYFTFIAESGVIQELKDLGFNTIQFLPFAQSIDGTNWKYRYLVPFQFAIQKNWGSPDDFAKMIDAFHEAGIAVIGDFVLGHLPHKDYRVFGQDCSEAGIHLWKARDRSMLYLKEETSWGTMRINFDNPHVRKFFISSCLHYMKHYRIDGFRIDNVDGIIRYGPNGEGDERPNGRSFLREFNSEIYEHNPAALIHYEAHYYYGDNAKLLVAPLNSDSRALGATAYNSSRLTYYFHTEVMLKSAEKITPWKFKHISDEKEWGKSNSTVADFHNHDAAAGLMPMRATGSYAYDAMTQDPTTHFHAIGKIKIMEAIISCVTEGRTLDLIQSFLLQKGTFEHDSSIHWFLSFEAQNKAVLRYKKEINELMDDPAFWPLFTRNRSFLNVDDQNKVLVVERKAEWKGKETSYIIIVNLTTFTYHHYKVGVRTKKNYEVILNSDDLKYGGSGGVWYPRVLENKESKNFELLDREVELFALGAYGVVILKEITQ